jgi:hypothetical protein
MRGVSLARLKPSDEQEIKQKTQISKMMQHDRPQPGSPLNKGRLGQQSCGGSPL